jgi:hypothetical protein
VALNQIVAEQPVVAAVAVQLADTPPVLFNGVSLPLSIVGPVDLGRLLRELDAVDSQLMEQAIMHADIVVPKLSKLLSDLTQLNKADLANDTHRATLRQALADCRLHAPMIHMSFSADPSVIFIERIMAWLRGNISPVVLLTIGLQPNLGAGCLIRTTNRQFDFSLRANFSQNRALLMSKLKAPDVVPEPELVA